MRHITSKQSPSPKHPTALSLACQRGDAPTAAALIAAGAALDRTDALGWTALIKACIHGHAGVVAHLLGAKASLERRSGQDALGWARAYGHDNVVALLEPAYAARESARAATSEEVRHARALGSVRAELAKPRATIDTETLAAAIEAAAAAGVPRKQGELLRAREECEALISERRSAELRLNELCAIVRSGGILRSPRSTGGGAERQETPTGGTPSSLPPGLSRDASWLPQKPRAPLTDGKSEDKAGAANGGRAEESAMESARALEQALESARSVGASEVRSLEAQVELLRIQMESKLEARVEEVMLAQAASERRLVDVEQAAQKAEEQRLIDAEQAALRAEEGESPEEGESAETARKAEEAAQAQMLVDLAKKYDQRHEDELKELRAKFMAKLEELTQKSNTPSAPALSPEEKKALEAMGKEVEMRETEGKNMQKIRNQPYVHSYMTLLRATLESSIELCKRACQDDGSMDKIKVACAFGSQQKFEGSDAERAQSWHRVSVVLYALGEAANAAGSAVPFIGLAGNAIEAAGKLARHKEALNHLEIMRRVRDFIASLPSGGCERLCSLVAQEAALNPRVAHHIQAEVDQMNKEEATMKELGASCLCLPKPATGSSKQLTAKPSVKETRKERARRCWRAVSKSMKRRSSQLNGKEGTTPAKAIAQLHSQQILAAIINERVKLPEAATLTQFGSAGLMELVRPLVQTVLDKLPSAGEPGDETGDEAGTKTVVGYDVNYDLGDVVTAKEPAMAALAFAPAPAVAKPAVAKQTVFAIDVVGEGPGKAAAGEAAAGEAAAGVAAAGEAAGEESANVVKKGAVATRGSTFKFMSKYALQGQSKMKSVTVEPSRSSASRWLDMEMQASLSPEGRPLSGGVDVAGPAAALLLEGDAAVRNVGSSNLRV